MNKNMHDNGFVTVDEMKIIHEALDALALSYAVAGINANNPVQMKNFASQKEREIRKLRESLTKSIHR